MPSATHCVSFLWFVAVGRTRQGQIDLCPDEVACQSCNPQGYSDVAEDGGPSIYSQQATTRLLSLCPAAPSPPRAPPSALPSLYENLLLEYDTTTNIY